MSTSHDAADFVRNWLREHSARFTHDEVESMISELKLAVGRELTYTQLSPEDFSAAIRAEGLPEDVIWLLDYLFATVLDGRNAYVTDGVQRALGRPPRDFRDYARNAATSGVWDVTA